MARVGDTVKVVNYPTHLDPAGETCQECNLNGLAGVVTEINDIYYEVVLPGRPDLSPFLFLPAEIALDSVSRIIDRKYLFVSYNGDPRPDGRKRKFRRNSRAKSIYIQLGGLEIVAWYR